jgi:hypothetical protein
VVHPLGLAEETETTVGKLEDALGLADDFAR